MLLLVNVVVTAMPPTGLEQVVKLVEQFVHLVQHFLIVIHKLVVVQVHS